MRYYKIINDNYLLVIGVGNGGKEITKTEYTELMNTISNRPTAPEGFAYRLTVNLEWVPYELPVVEEELTAEEALSIILGGEV